MRETKHSLITFATVHGIYTHSSYTHENMQMHGPSKKHVMPVADPNAKEKLMSNFCIIYLKIEKRAMVA